jgi:hypothetical protein
MAEYRKGFKVDPQTGLTEPEARAGLTREEAEAQAADEVRPAPAASTPMAATSGPKRGHRTAWIVAGSVGGLLLLLIIIGIAVGGSDSGSQSSSPGNANNAPPPPPPPAEPKKASNGDDAADLHNRAQQAVNRAEVCLAAVYLASQDTSNANSMATSLQQARSTCNQARSYLASNDSHGFTDQNTALFGAADEAKSATNAGLAYLDTQYPSKLADFTSHAQNASAFFKQGMSDLNARLSELGVAHVRQ